MLIATVSGKVFREPKLVRTTKGGFISFDIQTRKQYVKDPKKPFEWWRCEVFSSNPDKVFDFFKEGTWLMLSGYMEKDEYKDKDGKDKTSTKLKVNWWNLLGDKKSDSYNTNSNNVDPNETVREEPVAQSNNTQAPWE
ncbi:MAG: single-stranded DNA-binding protein [Candidatus Odinarchaeia archaeon]